jgi:acetyl esterase/lipase
MLVSLLGATAPAHATPLMFSDGIERPQSYQRCAEAVTAPPVPGVAARPTALLIHGGGFVDRAELSTPTAPLRRLGYRLRVAKYPLGDVRGAYRAVTRQAGRLGRTRPVVAIGESAGGSIATWLAGHRRVDAAVSVGAPQDFRAWGNPTRGTQVRLPTTALRRRYSPIRTYSRKSGDAPLFAVHYRGDIFAPFEQTTSLRNRGAHVLLLDGFGHTQPQWLHAGGLDFLRCHARPSGSRLSMAGRSPLPGGARLHMWPSRGA